MPSAAFASRDWRQSQFWGRHADVSFADVRRAALGALASVEQSEDDAFWSAAADAADAVAAAAQDDVLGRRAFLLDINGQLCRLRHIAWPPGQRGSRNKASFRVVLLARVILSVKLPNFSGSSSAPAQKREALVTKVWMPLAMYCKTPTPSSRVHLHL